MYQDGINTVEISKTVSVSVNYVRQYLHNNGIEKGEPKYVSVDEEFSRQWLGVMKAAERLRNGGKIVRCGRIKYVR